jgi:hypothetical protein
MQDNDGVVPCGVHAIVFAACGTHISEADFFILLFLRVFVGLSGAQDDQVTPEERTEPASSGGSRPLQLRLPNCIERARKKLQ